MPAHGFGFEFVIGRQVRLLDETQHREQPPGPQRPPVRQPQAAAPKHPLQGENRPPANCAGQRREQALEARARALVHAEMIDQNNFAARCAHPFEFAQNLDRKSVRRGRG